MHVKKGDNVIVITGKYKGQKADVAKILKDENRVILEGVGKVKRHMRPKKQGEKGGIVEIATSIHASNVKLAEKAAPKKKVTKKAA
ncbi:MAG: hypothetical protein RI935_280 [Candidatus Parcubacteria bacterium]